MKFTLEIELGNEAMQTPQDVATAVFDAARAMRNHSDIECPAIHQIRDSNGNTVGSWRVTE